MTAERVNPFADLSDFEAKPATKPLRPVEVAQIEQLAQDNGFPSRQPPKSEPAAAPAQTIVRPRRRYTTGRNQQINIKATAETINRLYRLADADRVPLGEILERALDALEREQHRTGQGIGRA